MITGALKAITSRAWLVELILLAAVVAGFWWLCHHLVDAGVQRQKEVDARELVKLQHDADVETERLQGVADTAGHAHDKELSDLRRYRIEHPLHGRLCLNQGSGHLPEASAADASNAGAGATTGNLLEVPAGDSGPRGQADPDVRHLLDLLEGRADFLSGSLREYQARR